MANPGARRRKVTPMHKQSPPRFLSTSQFETDDYGSAATLRRICAEHQGFALRLRGAYKIPREHYEALISGVPAAEIAARARSRAQRA